MDLRNQSIQNLIGPLNQQDVSIKEAKKKSGQIRAKRKRSLDDIDVPRGS